MIVPKLTAALKKAVSGKRDPFQTYKEFAARYGFNTSYCPSWAKKSVLDAVAEKLKADPKVGIDLTFIIRNGATGYPSVIDGRAYDESTAQKKRARNVSDQIIRSYQIRAKNPY